MTPAERRVARTLLATYPTAGLESLPQLADGAGVTGPTVLRFVRKIGFEGYPDFQRSLPRRGAGAHRGPALALPDEGRAPRTTRCVAPEPGGVHARPRRDARFQLARRRPRERRRAARAIGSAASGSWAAGSASSWRPTSACSCGCCGPGCAMVGESPEWRVLDSLELSRRDVLCLFDYRRYQRRHDRGGQGRGRAGSRRHRLHRPVALSGGGIGEARADLARGLGVAVRLVARGVRARQR